MAVNLVIPEKNSEDGYEEPINVGTDGLAAQGFYVQLSGATPGTMDQTVGLERGPSGSLLFKDQQNSSYTLTQLAAPITGSTYDLLLSSEPPAPDFFYSFLLAGQNVTQELWKRTDQTFLKTIDYTYSMNKVSLEVRKIFAADGSTVVAQLTNVYNYPGGLHVEISGTRDV